MNLPANDIVVIHRSDGSGTTYIWTDYLSKVSPDWKDKVSKGTSVNWPVGLGGKGNEGVTGSDQADAEFDRLRGTDLCRAEQDSLWKREELVRDFRKGGSCQRNRSGGRLR